jgi:hypothetical protein
MLKCVNDGVMTTKPGHQSDGKAHMIWLYELFFMLFFTSGRVYVWSTPNLKSLVSTVKHGEVMWQFGQ